MSNDEDVIRYPHLTTIHGESYVSLGSGYSSAFQNFLHQIERSGVEPQNIEDLDRVVDVDPSSKTNFADWKNKLESDWHADTGIDKYGRYTNSKGPHFSINSHGSFKFFDRSSIRSTKEAWSHPIADSEEWEPCPESKDVYVFFQQHNRHQREIYDLKTGNYIPNPNYKSDPIRCSKGFTESAHKNHKYELEDPVVTLHRSLSPKWVKKNLRIMEEMSEV